MTGGRPARPGRRTGVVTGASRGLGAVVARFLAGEGFDLVLVARDAAALERVAEELRALGATVHVVAGDLTEPATRERVCDRVRRLGGLDLLVNNAATLGPTPLPPLVEARPEDVELVYRVNVVAPLALTGALASELSARSGLVVNLSSDAAVGGYPGWGNYGASKAALDLASLTLAHELASTGISVISVDPGDLRTPGAKGAFSAQEFDARPLPDVTVPFWAWLLGQRRSDVSGRRFLAQAEHWGVPA
jgi:NAD(P)-dependent dehydrogenase (short-subunit alcohol dehydrogenase family)